jgi:hypothetical protein
MAVHRASKSPDGLVTDEQAEEPRGGDCQSRRGEVELAVTSNLPKCNQHDKDSDEGSHTKA